MWEVLLSFVCITKKTLYDTAWSIAGIGWGKFQATCQPGQPVGEASHSTYWAASDAEGFGCWSYGRIVLARHLRDAYT